MTVPTAPPPAAPRAAQAAPEDPGLGSWVLALLLWAECLVAVVAALRAPGGWAQPVVFGLYAALLAVAAVARSGPLRWMRPVTWLALAAVAGMHLAAWALPLGRQPPQAPGLLAYLALVAVGALGVRRERPLPRDRALPRWARGLEVTGRAAGLGFLAGVLLAFANAVVRLPFSGH